MTKPTQNFELGRALALGLTLSMSVASLPGCSFDEVDGSEASLRAIGTMIQSQTYSATTSPESPIVADAAILPDLQAQVKPFLVDGSPSSTPWDLFAAGNIAVQGVDGSVLQLERISNGLRVLGVEGNVGILWNSNFTQIAFHTPQGTYRMALQGATLAERRALAANLSILALGGTEEAAPAMAAAAWPVAAIIGLVAVSWGALCLAYTKMCQDEAEQMCPNGYGSVDVSCGGISMTLEEGEKFPSGSFELGGFDCSYDCDPPSGGDEGGEDDGGEGPLPEPPTTNWPEPNWDEVENPCPPGQSPQPCAVTETTTTSDTSGPIEEITVTSSTSFGYCCMDDS